MPLTAEVAAHQVQERLRSLQGLIYNIDNERRRNEPNLNNIFRIQERLSHDERSVTMQQQLKSLYKMGMHDAAQEENFIRQALARIQEIRAIRNECRMQARIGGKKETIGRGTLMKMLEISAQTLPLFVSKMGERIPPLCGAIPADSSYIAKPGDMVAALVKSLDDEANWILAEVVSFLPGRNKYEVDDIDEEQKDRHILSKSRVIPLPLMRANPETDSGALFPQGTMVNALYPQTTCFYKAIIHQLPQTATEEYRLLFEDRDYADGYSPPLCVPQRYVIAYKHDDEYDANDGNDEPLSTLVSGGGSSNGGKNMRRKNTPV